VTFADHSLATDSVFSETHLIVPQRADLFQQEAAGPRARPVPRVAVPPRLSGLGSKESMDFPAYAPRFEPVLKRERLFRKR
jgi:chemotaxis protein methyltransferase CheR